MQAPTEPRERAFVHPDIDTGQVAVAVRAAFGRHQARPDALEFSQHAMTRVLADLMPEVGKHVLLVEPASALLPAALAALGANLTVCIDDRERADRVRAAFDGGERGSVWVTRSDDAKAADGRQVDRILVVSSTGATLPKALLRQLAPDGVAIWAGDGAQPPRRMFRLLRSGEGADANEELDLVRFAPLLGDLLVEGGYALRQEVCEAVHRADKSGRKVGKELLASGAVREEDLFRTLAH